MAIEFWAAGSNSIVSEISFVMTWLIQVLPWKTSKTRYWSRAKGVWDVGTVVCAVLEIAKINIVWEEWGNVSKMLEVSPTLLLLISCLNRHLSQATAMTSWCLNCTILWFCIHYIITVKVPLFLLCSKQHVKYIYLWPLYFIVRLIIQIAATADAREQL